MQLLTRSIAAALAMIATAAHANDAESTNFLPGWLAGAWLAELPDGSWAEEWWSPAKGGVMLGAGRSGKGEGVAWWEQTRIERHKGKTRFCALPKGQGGTCFTATKLGPSEAVFENLSHDFPTRVVYRREGEGLFAEISGPNGSNSQQWRFRRRD